MEVRRFYGPDIQEISNWYRERDMTPIASELLPPVGFIVPGIAAAHLYQTDGSIALFEGFISNPDTKREDRIQALNLIIGALTNAAKMNGFKCALAITSHPTIIEGCIKNNFHDLGQFQMFSIGVN